MGRSDPAALSLSDVTLVREGRAILNNVSWNVGADERWVVLGRKAAGATGPNLDARAWSSSSR